MSQIIDTAPTCPHCDHRMTTDEMVDYGELDLFALAPDEGREEVKCPSCDKTYWLRGSYVPQYHSAMEEDDL